MCKRSAWMVVGAAALAVLAVLGAVGLWLGTPTSSRTPARIPVAEIATSMVPQDNPLTPQQQQLMNVLPAGYAPGSCQPSANPPPLPDTVASLDCFNNSLAGGPIVARYEMFADQNTLNNQFQIDANNAALQPCPGWSDAAPGTWNFKNNPNQVAGSMMCFTTNNGPSMEWSNNQYLTLGDTSGADLAGLVNWFNHLP
jgi:serine/threonine kinase PknH